MHILVPTKRQTGVMKHQAGIKNMKAIFVINVCPNIISMSFRNETTPEIVRYMQNYHIGVCSGPEVLVLRSIQLSMKF